MSAARQPKGIPVGGQFATASHPESGLTLAASRPAELDLYGPIPASREGQAFADGSPVPEGDFEDAYREFFRPLDEHEAMHGAFTPQQGPSESEIQALAGIQNVNLGRERGTSLEEDENGEPVIVVHTRNGGGNRECWTDDCDGSCTGCIQTEIIPSLPTYLRDADDDGDSTYANNYFRPLDPAAAKAILAARKRAEALHLRKYLRKAITEGKAPPWEILEQVHGEEVPYDLLRNRSKAAEDERNHRRYAGMAPAILEAVRTGTKAPAFGAMMRGPAGQFKYDCAVGNRDRAQARAGEARQAEAALQAELSMPLPPTVKALATAELERLSGEVAKEEGYAAKEAEKVAAVAPQMTAWAEQTLQESEDYAAKTAAAEAAVRNFDWARSWPGDLEDCPPRPAAE